MGKEELLEFGLRVFNYEAHKFLHWLNHPNTYLDGAFPNEMLDTEEGRKLVLKELYTIEYGNYA